MKNILQDDVSTFEQVLVSALKLPGVKVNRREFIKNI